jgi:hypothetical protein
MEVDRRHGRLGPASAGGLASLLYFAAAVPTVGFIHGAPDLSALNAAALEGCFPSDRASLNSCFSDSQTSKPG